MQHLHVFFLSPVTLHTSSPSLGLERLCKNSMFANCMVNVKLKKNFQKRIRYYDTTENSKCYTIYTNFYKTIFVETIYKLTTNTEAYDTESLIQVPRVHPKIQKNHTYHITTTNPQHASHHNHKKSQKSTSHYSITPHHAPQGHRINETQKHTRK